MNSKGASNIQVYIAAHVPPGVFELNPETNWFHDDFNDAYMDIVEMSWLHDSQCTHVFYIGYIVM